MHWSDCIADEIIKNNPEKEEYTCAAGISPSGSIHIGNFRDVATSLFVVRALERRGKKARLLFSWDEFDRLRKVPVNVERVKDNFENYIGYPYVDIPNPFDTEEKTYAEYFEKEFEESMKAFSIKMEYRHQAELYRSGLYKEYIICALNKRKQIFDILDGFRTQQAVEGERDNYYPVGIYCPICHRDTTTIISYDEDTKIAKYVCKCSHEGIFDFKKDTNCKLAWKVDWPMRWMVEKVDFEPGGKDHAAPGGSYDASKQIAKKIFGYTAPVFKGYEFIGIKGTTGKMSGSSGLNLTPRMLLNVYQPQVLLWLYAKVEPQKAFELCLDDGILRQYYEFDRQYEMYVNGSADESVKMIMKSCLLTDTKIQTVSMSLLAQLGSIVNFNVSMMETIFEKIGQPYKYNQFKQRLRLAQYWVENCSPENANKLLKYRNWGNYAVLADDIKREIEMLYDYLKKNTYSLEELNTQLYTIPKQIFGEDKDIKKHQADFFRAVYQLLLGKEKGPRLYLFLYAIEKEQYLNLLDFSTPILEEEKQCNASMNEKNEEKLSIKYGDPDEIDEEKKEITIDLFDKVDLRVCRIIKCQEIRKSHDCYKLTVFDGIRNRVIVSSIKKYYSIDELIGKKIIVIINLAPVRITGVKSEGMLLAATNSASGCKVPFIDDMVPEGTKIC